MQPGAISDDSANPQATVRHDRIETLTCGMVSSENSVNAMSHASQKNPSEAYITARYERWRTMTVPFEYKRSKSERLAAILLQTGGFPKRALELGVGPGGIAGPLSHHGIRLVGMDLSIEALLRAKDHCKNDDVSLLRGSGFSLPFASGSFPVVYASQVLHLFDHDGRLALMREARNRLRVPVSGIVRTGAAASPGLSDLVESLRRTVTAQSSVPPNPGHGLGGTPQAR